MLSSINYHPRSEPTAGHGFGAFSKGSSPIFRINLPVVRGKPRLAADPAAGFSSFLLGIPDSSFMREPGECEKGNEVSSLETNMYINQIKKGPTPSSQVIWESAW